MFREMRRAVQQIANEEAIAVLERGSNGIMACLGDDGYPYAVPLNYAYTAGKIYFHAAKVGHKMDAIIAQPKVSFAVVDQDDIVSAEYTSYFRSAIAFGTARIVEGEEWVTGFRAIVEKYSGDQPVHAKEMEISGCGHSAVVAIDIQHLTGKVNRRMV